MVILLVFHAGDPGSIQIEGNFFVFNLIFPIFYSFCNKSLVAFYIKFNALAKSSHQPLFFYIYIIFQMQTALSQLQLQIWGYVIVLVRILPNLWSHFFKSKFPTYPTQNPC